MKNITDPEWKALELRIIAWDERIRHREHEIKLLDDRLRELEQRLGALRRRLAFGTGAMVPISEPRA